MDKKSAHLALHLQLYKAISSWELDIYSEELKEKNKWPVKNGRDAISLYLVKKHGWTIEHCRSLSDEVLRLTLADELNSWKPPKQFSELLEPISEFLKKYPVP
jgi:hypothetical protein